MIFEGDKYVRICNDFAYVGKDCCKICHDDPKFHLSVVTIDAEPALLCCALRGFFYPNKKLSPEEKLFIAIFGEGLHSQSEEAEQSKIEQLNSNEQND